MCGRFTLRRFPKAWAEELGLGPIPDLPPRYNIAPGQYITTILRDAEFPAPIVQQLSWGLLPHWAKDKQSLRRPINARAESAAEKPTFRAPLRHRRCLIPADGFFEWAGSAGHRQPCYFQMLDEGPFALAGIWDHWEGAGGEMIDSCAILTTRPNALIQPLHDRMPVILQPQDFTLWLDPSIQSARHLDPLLRPYPAAGMKLRAVSPRVNSSSHDDPACIAPRTAATPPDTDAPATPPDPDDTGRICV